MVNMTTYLTPDGKCGCKKPTTVLTSLKTTRGKNYGLVEVQTLGEVEAHDKFHAAGIRDAVFSPFKKYKVVDAILKCMEEERK